MHDELARAQAVRHAELLWMIAVMHSDKQHRPEINDFLPEAYRIATPPTTEETIARIDQLLAEEDNKQ